MSNAGIERGRRAPQKAGKDVRSSHCPAARARRAEGHRPIPEADSPDGGPPRGAERRSDPASQGRLLADADCARARLRGS